MRLARSADDETDLLALARREHEARLTRYARRLLHDAARAGDAVQETFLALARQPAEPDLRPRLAAWLFTVCRRKALNQIRADARLEAFEHHAPGLAADEASPVASLEAKEDRQELLALVARLPERQREVVRLRYQEGFSYQEIAAITEHSVNHVGVLLHQALQALRRAWPTEGAG
ncbi:MAG: sigma-70 family RNA polymerase sigma factor [Opitutaceae bacterium]|jgi:RNA polymerase sigma-70 factor (ECF subfamily)|nr:sigma-70 family RNA polymerase sigma factor [Opitutaceae bacterium]